MSPFVRPFLSRRAAGVVRSLPYLALVAVLASGCAAPGARSPGGPGGPGGPDGSTPSRVLAAGAGPVLAGAPTPGRPGASPSARPGLVAPVPDAALPPDAAPATDHPCAQQRRPTGWVAAENARPGTPLPPLPADASGVLGYLDASSAACGDAVGVHLSGTARPVEVAAYRLGWYRGTGARLVWRSALLTVPPQPWAAPATGTSRVEPHWATALTLTIGADWPPGMYALVPLDAGRAVGPLIPLVVRDDAGTEPALFAASTLTWNAYDTFTGHSLYGGPGRTAAQRFATRARVVALHRPLVGDGYDQLRFMDLPVVRWLESLGLDVAYTTDVDVDTRPSQVLQHAELVLGGHAEYWTTRMYDTLEAAIGRGVNVALLGANNVWWHARIEDGGRFEAVYRVAAEDPLAAADPTQSTTLWGSAPLHRDAAEITGQTHAGIRVHGGLELLRPPAWLTTGTTLHDGSLLPGSVGNEADGYNPAAHRPDHLQVLAAGVLTGSHGPVLVTTNYAVALSGAGIFAAGSTDWACELGPRCSTGRAPQATEAAVQALTRNVVLAFATPRAGVRNPVDPVLPPDAAHFLVGLPADAVGGYGGSQGS